MYFSKHKTIEQGYKTIKRVKMEETVKHVKAMEVMIMTVLAMIQITIRATLTSVEVSLQVPV